MLGEIVNKGLKLLHAVSWEARNIICHWLGRDVANKKIPTALHIFEGDTLHQKRTQV